MTARRVAHRATQRGFALAALALAALALVASLGIGLSREAHAATDTVAVTATVGSSVSVADACSGAVSIAVVLGGYADGSCAIDFGSTNDSTTTLRIGSSAGAFMSGGFTDHVGACGVLSGDTAGVKVTSVSASVTSSLGCTVSAAGTNADYLAVPDAMSNACAATALGTTNRCTLAVGIKETGADTTAGSYSGTLNIDVIG